MNFRFIYTGIRVKNMDESIKFYTEVLGMDVAEKRERTEPTKGEGVTLKSPDSNQLLGLNFYESDSPVLLISASSQSSVGSIKLHSNQRHRT